MVKVTFEGADLSELKENIKDFFAGVGDNASGGESAGAEPKRRSRSTPKDKDPEPEKVTHSSIRKYLTENEDKKSLAQEMLADRGLDSISDIKEEKLEGFLTKLKEA